MKTTTKTLSTRLAALALAGTLLSACFGNFALTRTVYDLNSRVQNGFVQSAVTWVFVILPVYSLAATVDFLALNVIQFWTGTNPIRAQITDSDGTQVASSREIIDGEDVLVLRSTEKDGTTQRVEFRKVDESAMHARILNNEGELVDETIIPMEQMSAEKLTELSLRH